MKDTKDSKTYVDIYSGRRIKNRKFRKSNSSRNNASSARMFFVKIFLYVLLFLVAGFVVGCVIYYYRTLNSFNYEATEADEPISEIQLFDNSESNREIFTNANGALTCKRILNVLLVGSDSMSAGDGGRSDSILLVSVDTCHKKVKITSFMRDTWVKIPGFPDDRINAAYAHGKSRLLANTIEKNFGIAIDRYAEADFAGFVKIFDILGGLDVEVSAQEVRYINSKSSSKTKLRGSGLLHLNGDQILQYCRDRDSIGSDYDRTKRQRYVVSSAISKMQNANAVQLVQIVSAVAPNVTTNFKPDEITKFTTKSLEFAKFGKDEYRVPEDDNLQHKAISGKSVIIVKDNSKLRKNLAQFIFEDLVDVKK